MKALDGNHAATSALGCFEGAYLCRSIGAARLSWSLCSFGDGYAASCTM
jgi:hypothetical protein